MQLWIEYLLKMLALADGSDDRLEDLRNLNNKLDEGQWIKLFYHVRNSGLAGYFHKKSLWLAQHAGCNPPMWFVQKCRHLYDTYTYKGMMYKLLYQEVSQKLDEGNIEYIPLKGIDLIDSLYPYIGWRALGDLDILIRHKDISVADKILRESGFVLNDEKARERSLRYHHHLHYTTDFYKHKMTLELHWHIGGKYLAGLDFNLLWNEIFSGEKGADSFERHLSHSYLFVILMNHAARHGYRISLKWLMDLFLLCRKQEDQLELNKTTELIYASHSKRAAFFVCTLTTNMFKENSMFQDGNFFQALMQEISLPEETAAILNHLSKPMNFLERADFLRDKWPSYFFNLFLRDDATTAYNYAQQAVLWKLHLEGLID